VVGKRRKWKRSATAVADNSIEGRVGGVESLGAEGSEIRAARLRGCSSAAIETECMAASSRGDFDRWAGNV
jgi:hypothetical protein